jgi:hypothetical protein
LIISQNAKPVKSDLRILRNRSAAGSDGAVIHVQRRSVCTMRDEGIEASDGLIVLLLLQRLDTALKIASEGQGREEQTHTGQATVMHDSTPSARKRPFQPHKG